LTNTGIILKIFSNKIKRMNMFDGIYPPLPTPFINDEIAFDKLQLNIAEFNKTGLRGYVTLGSNGESAFLTREEKIQLVKCTKEAASKEKVIIAGTGSDSVKETLILTNEAAKAGANAALVLTPSYYKSQMDSNAIISYFTRVADSADIPLFIYNVPKFTGIDIQPAAVARLAGHKNIIGIKDSTESIVHIMEIISLVPADFILFTGTGSVLYPALTAGARGGIAALANVAPNECVDIYESILKGELTKALQLQKKLLPLNRAVTARYGVAGLKKAMDFAGYYGGNVRIPLPGLSSEEIEDIKEIVNCFLKKN
jgi:4-hydroxy-2-oxoglutarate aldolase